jgi:hypothetical protein
MNKNFTYLLLLCAALSLSTGLLAQTDGDYRTKANGNWNDFVNTWEVFSAGSWIAAGHSPTSADGVISILNGHTILVNVDITADQIVVNNGGELDVNSTLGTGGILTLADGTGTDLFVDATGILRLGGFQTIAPGTGTPNIIMNGTMVWSSGTLDVPTVTGAASVLNVTNAADQDKNVGADFTNGGTLNWAAGPTAGAFFLSGGMTFTNAATGIINENFSVDKGFGGGTGNSFVNNGTINKTTSSNLRISSTFTNTGLIQGTSSGNNGGIVNTGSPANGILAGNSGIISPGNGTVSGIMTVEPSMFAGQTPTLRITIASTGDVAGANYDQLNVVGAPDFTTTTLNIGNHGSDGVGTNFAIVTTTGLPAGPFASVAAPNSLTTPAFSATGVTVTTQTPLPLTWGPFNALGLSNNTVSLTWTTLQEENVSRFVVEYSTDGKAYKAIGTVAAAGNTSSATQYKFIQTNPILNGTNFYRLQEVDLDGKATYSSVRALKFNNGQIIKVLATPNPVHDLLQLNVQDDGISAIVVDGQGRTLHTWILQKGSQEMNVNDLPAGNYTLVIFQHQQRIDAQHILKF